MFKKIVRGVFPNSKQAGKALEALGEQKVAAKDITVVGPDSDKFREITEPLQSRRPDRYVVGASVIGAVFGAALALLVTLPTPFGTGIFSFTAMIPVMGAIAGAAAGAMLGLFAGTVVHFDVPDYEAEVATEEKVPEVAVSVTVDKTEDRLRVERLMQKFGAVEVDSIMESVEEEETPREPAASGSA